MAVDMSSNAGRIAPAPLTDPRQSPKAEAKTPQDNTAAREAPQETRAAVGNTFGKVPPNKMTPPPAAANPPRQPKASLTMPPRSGPANDPKLAQTAGGAPPSAADPRVQTILDTQRADGKTVREKLDADAPAYLFKAAQDHYNKQKENKEAPDAASRFYLNSVALFMAQNGIKEDNITPDKLAKVFDKDIIRKNLVELARDPDFRKWSAEQQANAVEDTVRNNGDIASLVQPYLQEGENYVNALRRMQSDYLTSQDFADAVGTAKTAEDGRNLVADGFKTLSSLGLGEKETLGVANALAENIRSKYKPDAPKAVIDPQTNQPVKTADGYSMATLPDGTIVAFGADGKAVADKQGNAYVYNLDGSARVDASGAYVQYDARAKAAFASYGGTRHMVDTQGKGRTDAQGRPMAIDSGAPVVLDANGRVVTDQAGNKIVVNADTGKAVTDPQSGNAVVIDPKTRAIVQAGADGKVVAAGNGDPYAVDQNTGRFVQDAQGRYVMVSRSNVAPGLLPGYVVDPNKSKIVVNPANGTPLLDPATGRTVILTPDRNVPEVVPLDAAGKPLLTEDGKNVVVDQNGHTVVRDTDSHWLVDAAGKYASDGDGHYIGVGPKSGLASPVDAKGAPVLNGNGQVPLWDPKTNSTMTTPDGNQIVLDKTGSPLVTDKEGRTLVEEKTGLPYLVDPRTREIAVNPYTQRSVLLDTSGAAVEYNADDGYKYLVDPKTNTSVKTPEGIPITIDDKAAMPVAVNADGSNVRNPETGNTIVYNIDGKPAVDAKSGAKIEITPDGKAHLIDPKTLIPVGSRDKTTGGIQLYNKDGSDLQDPATGNKVQIDRNGHRVEVDATTGKFATDAYGNTLILAPDNTQSKTPGGNTVVIDKQTGSPVAVDANGKVEVDPDSGLPRFINTNTGKALEDPVSKAAVVVDPKSGAPVQTDPKTGAPVLDPVTGLNVVANPETGAPLKGPNGEPVGVMPGLNQPVYFDKQINALTIADPLTGKAQTNPKTGATHIIDPQYGVPVQVLPDKDGKLVLVDNDGRTRDDGLGNILYLDKDTGQVTITLPDGSVVDALTVKAPDKVDPKAIIASIPYPPRIPIPHGQPGKDVPPAESTVPGAPDATGEVDIPAAVPAEPYGVAGPSGTQADPVIPPARTEPWADPAYRMTPEERAQFAKYFDEITGSYESYDTEARAIEAIKKQNPALQNIDTTDLVALRAYTRGGKFRALNRALYTGNTDLLKTMEPWIKGVQSALNQMRDAGFAYEGPASRWMLLKAAEFDSLFPEGGYFRNLQILSTSKDLDRKWHGNTNIKYDKIKGVSIESVSAVAGQQEVVGDINSLHRIKSIDEWSNPIVSQQFGKTVNATSVPEPGAGTAVDEILPDTRPVPAEDIDTPKVAAEPMPPGARDAGSRWRGIGKALGIAGETFNIATGALQSVAGGFQIDYGIRTDNPLDIASGALGVASGTFAIASSAAALIGGALAAAALPLAGLSLVAAIVAEIIDFANAMDDDRQFADELAHMYEPLGILKEGWRPNAEAAYRDSRSVNHRRDVPA